MMFSKVAESEERKKGWVNMLDMLNDISDISDRYNTETFKTFCGYRCEDLGIDFEDCLKIETIEGELHTGWGEKDIARFHYKGKISEWKDKVNSYLNTDNFFDMGYVTYGHGKGVERTAEYLKTFDIEDRKLLLMLAFLWGYIRERSNLDYDRHFRKNIENIFKDISKELFNKERLKDIEKGLIKEDTEVFWLNVWHHNCSSVLPSERLNLSKLQNLEDLPLMFALRMAEVFNQYRLVRVISTKSYGA